MESYNKGKSLGSLESYVRENFLYDSNTGVITRIDRKNSNGSFDKDGYLILKIKGRQFKAHRIAWFLYYNEMPIMEIDHINRIRTDNRIVNLRLADRFTNVNNISVSKNKETGVVGIYIDKTTGLKKKYTTSVSKKIYRFYTLEEAIKFREENGKAI